MSENHYSLMVAGPETSAGILAVRSPYTGDTIATVDLCGAEHIEAALQLAHAKYRDKSSWLGVVQRQQILRRAAELMASRREELVRCAASEGGKPWVDSVVEINRAIDGVHMCAEHIATHAGELIPLKEPLENIRRVAFTQREPIGVVVAVSAFNHPLNLIVHQVGAAIAAGCPVIVKPSNDTPLSCLEFVAILREAGLPDDYCQAVVPEKTALATELVADERVGFFSFIGSARVGWMLRSKLAAGARCALEHGGVAPVIVDKAAKLDKVVPSLLKGGFYHAGQVCVSVQRVYVHESLCEPLLEAMVKGAEALKVGDPLSPDVEVGPLIRHAELERVESWVNSAVEAGATLLCGGARISDSCYQPTILLNPPASSEVSKSEVFGPVVCVYSYTDVTEAIDAANSLDVAFQAAVFTENIDAALCLSSQLDASAVMINDHTAYREDSMPFAGLKHAGLGVGGIGHTINDMQIDKMIMIKTPSV